MQSKEPQRIAIHALVRNKRTKPSTTAATCSFATGESAVTLTVTGECRGSHAGIWSGIDIGTSSAERDI